MSEDDKTLRHLTTITDTSDDTVLGLLVADVTFDCAKPYRRSLWWQSASCEMALDALPAIVAVIRTQFASTPLSKPLNQVVISLKEIERQLALIQRYFAAHRDATGRTQ